MSNDNQNPDDPGFYMAHGIPHESLEPRPDNETGRDEIDAAFNAARDEALIEFNQNAARVLDEHNTNQTTRIEKSGGAAYHIGAGKAQLGMLKPDGSIDPIPWPKIENPVQFGQPNESEFSLDLGATSLDFTVTEVHLSGSQVEDGDNFISRMFEPEPLNARLVYRPGDTVKLKRRDLFGLIPLGAVGVVQQLEHPESAMSAKGRPYFIRFDLTPFNLPWPEQTVKFYEANKRPGDPDMPALMVEAATNFGVNDLELIAKGDNWRPDYEHEYEYDRLAEAMENMTPDEFREHLKEIFANLAPPRMRTPGTPPAVEDGVQPSPGFNFENEDYPPGWIDPATLPDYPDSPELDPGD